VQASVFIFLGLFGFYTFAEQASVDQAWCARVVKSKVELTDSEQRTVLNRAQRFHHGYTGKWGQFLQFSQAVAVGNTLHVVVRFKAEPRDFEFVAVYDLQSNEVTSFLAPDEKGRIYAYELE
jgi:hypothetical protein